MPVTLIAALSRNRCIGKNGTIPWRIPEDMAHFKALTTGNVVVMGRKTWESLPERFRPLPERTNIVLTRQTDYPLPDGVERYVSLTDALEAHPYELLFVIGGGEVYKEALPLADRLELTHVDQDVDGDAFFPEIGEVWKEVTREDHDGFSFVSYQQ
jgi:dihydrofolate reductase